LCLGSSETVSLARPLARRAFKTFLPLAVAILSLKPCLFFLFLFDGWYVLFIAFYLFFFLNFRSAKIAVFFIHPNRLRFSFAKLSIVLFFNVKPEANPVQIDDFDVGVGFKIFSQAGDKNI
jgi:hypothetical protein